MIQAELPGVKKEDINIELKDGMLTISGERRQEKKEQGETWRFVSHSALFVRFVYFSIWYSCRRSERSFGKFVRSMSVPRDVTEEQIKASYRDGVLEVNFPKPREAKKQTRPIMIQ